MAFGAGGPHFCLGANLARMEIRVMFEHLLDRMPDITLDGEVERLQSAFISGVKHIPVAFPAGRPRVGLMPSSADRPTISKRSSGTSAATRSSRWPGACSASGAPPTCPMDEIAAEAGVARSTVYVYFANRDELLRACLKGMHDQLLEDIAETWEHDAEPAHRLERLVEAMLERIDDNPAFFRLALLTQGTVSQGGEAVGTELALIGLNIARLITDLYVDGVASGVFREMDPDQAVGLIGQQIYGAMSVRAAEPLPPEAVGSRRPDLRLPPARPRDLSAGQTGSGSRWPSSSSSSSPAVRASSIAPPAGALGGRLPPALDPTEPPDGQGDGPDHDEDPHDDEAGRVDVEVAQPVPDRPPEVRAPGRGGRTARWSR